MVIKAIFEETRLGAPWEGDLGSMLLSKVSDIVKELVGLLYFS